MAALREFADLRGAARHLGVGNLLKIGSNLGAIRRPLGLPANGLHARLPK